MSPVSGTMLPSLLIVIVGNLGLGFAVARLTNEVPATAENRSAEMKAAVKSVFFSTGDPCLILGRFGGKSVFVKVS